MDLEGEHSLPTRSTAQSHFHDTHTSNSLSIEPVEVMSTSRNTDNAHVRTKEMTERPSGEKAITVMPAAARPKPLHLLDLPLDILSMIVKEITHTNDLCSVAMTHSALHNLVIPHIYSRFDIVWPDATTNAEPRAGVDALTYGLATLVMSEEVFGEAPSQQRTDVTSGCPHCTHCSADPASLSTTDTALPSSLKRKRRRGNHYASFTRKFSLGNGPADWVQEYLMTKESGKMLGSLVALAVARMRNLESFIWDMPTGIVRDVWVALASLGENAAEGGCRLEKVWVRWHNNSTVDGNSLPPSSPNHEPNTFPQPISTATNIASDAETGAGTTPATDAIAARSRHINKVERPTFSILPPLKSLNVLDIDELAYLDEMSVLIDRSRHCLRELRVSIAREASGCDWTGAWEGVGLHQLPEKAANMLIGTSHYEKRLGGVLGVLVGRFFCLRVPRTSSSGPAEFLGSLKSVGRPLADKPATAANPSAAKTSNLNGGTAASVSEKSATETIMPITSSSAEAQRIATTSSPAEPKKSAEAKGCLKDRTDEYGIMRPFGTGNLRLEVRILELERVPLSVSVLCGAVDWSILQELTILDCPNHEQLWKVLRRKYTPKSTGVSFIEIPNPPAPGRRRKSNHAMPDPSEYELKLRKVHTNCVSTSLISFLKDALAPNSLEALFLHQSRHYTSKVGIESIIRGPIRRHRASLKQISLDSRHRDREDGASAVGYRKWMFDRELLNFITSGKMPYLRELAMAIDVKDWHYFLQRLPSIPHLHSLYIPFVVKETGYVPDHDAKELALQIIDIITLRREIELCYLGIGGKCFEVLESRLTDREAKASDARFRANTPSQASEDDDDEDEDNDDDESGDGDGDEADGNDGSDGHEDEETETEDEDLDSDDYDSDDGMVSGKAQLRLRLREILFYDDKVAIFKARHGRL